MKHLKIFMVLVLMVIMAGCSQVKVDGDITDTEAALIRTAVGSAFLAKPELVGPTFVVADTVLSNLEGETVLVSALETLVNKELEGDSYTKAEKQSILDLFNLAITSVYEEVQIDALDIGEQTEVVKKILEIVRASAQARL